MQADFSTWFQGKALSTDWTSRFFPVWASVLAARREQALDVLEIGSWEGRSAIFFLRYLPSCRLTCIDSFAGSAEHALRLKWSRQLPHIEQRFDANLAEFAGRFEKIKALSSQALTGLVAARRRFDLIYVDGSHNSADVLADAVASWQMLDEGGLIIFDDYEWSFFAEQSDRPKLGIDAFHTRHRGEYRELHRGEQLIVQKIVPLETAGAGSVQVRPAKPLPDSPAENVEFVLIAEAGVLEAQALLLCESVRAFAGAYARCPITVVSPRSERRPSASTVEKLERMGVDYLPLEIESSAPQYSTSWRIHALAHVERRPGPPVIVQLDSDAIFIDEPDLSLEDCDAAARPVDSKGMCTTGPGDPFDPYWRALCRLAGVDYDHVPFVVTTDGAAVVKASYNGGLIAARRACGLFQRTEDVFRQLVAAELKPWRDQEPTYLTGTGLKSGEATAYWGTSQAAFSLAAVAGNHAVRCLADTHNFPLHNLTRPRPVDPSRLVHIHYHGLFTAGSTEANPIFDGRLDLPAGIPEWLQARLALTVPPLPNGRAARPQRKAILILGMHRSGTSLLGGMVNALGAAGPKTVIPGDENNPRGYWESMRVNTVASNLLAAAGSNWYDWLPLDPDWMASGKAEAHRHKLKAILASEFGDQPLFFIKDPRLCRFIPLLSSILAEMRVDAVAMLPVRNPLEVAASIRTRDGLPIAKSLMVWLSHVLDAELHSRRMPRSLLLHEKVLLDWQNELSKAAGTTGLVWPTPPDQARVAVGNFLSHDLHHERRSVEDLHKHDDVTPMVGDSYEILRAMARDGDSPALRDRLDRIRSHFDDSRALLRQAIVAEQSIARQLVDDRDLLLRDRDTLILERESLIQTRDAMLASTSWRLTAPLRRLRKPSAS